MSLELYPIFYRRLVLRKKTDLVNPRFHPTADIRFPRNSLFVFLGKDESIIGPSNDEPFITNYTDQINVDFAEEADMPCGKIRTVQIDRRKLQINYFKSHYKYTRVRNRESAMRLEKQLYVLNMASALQGKRYVANRFVNFEKAYNRFATLIKGIKDAASLGNRNIFVHLELPPGLPGWQRFLTSFNAYKETFVDGVPKEITNKSIDAFKDYGHYWLMDFFAFLLGKYEYSLFGKLTDEEMARLNIILTFNSKALLVNLGKLKEWFDETSYKKKSENPRINATKRFILALITLINDGSTVSSTKSEDIIDVQEEEEGEDGGGLNAPDTGDEGKGEEEEIEKTVNSNSTLDDLFAEPKKSNSDSDTSKGESRSDRDNPDDKQVGSDNQTSSEVDGDEPSVEEIDWTDEVSDDLLEEIKIDSSEAENKNIFATPTSGIERALEERAKGAGLTVAERDFYLKKAQSYKSIKMPNGETLEEFVKIDEKKLRKLDGTIEADIPNVLDKSMLHSKATELKLGYVEKFLKKDIANVILGVQNAGICLTGLECETIVNAEGAYDIYKTKMLPVDGSASSPLFRFPRVDKDGTFTVDGVKQVLQTAKMEIPIRKINEYTVALTSYYDRKIMVTRSQLVSNDYGRALAKAIKGRKCNPDLKYVLGQVFNKSTVSPRYYSMFATNFKSIVTNGYEFEFDYQALLIRDPSAKEHASEELFPVGFKDGKLVIIDKFGMLYSGGVALTTIEEALGIPPELLKKMPTDIVRMAVNGVEFPIGVVLCYYFGIDQLLKVLNISPRVIPVGERVLYSEDEFVVSCSDEHLVFNRRDLIASYIFGGLEKLPNISNFSRFDLNNPGVWIPVMGDARVKPSHFREMKLMLDMFIDPITKEELVKRGYPTDLNYLLIEAVKMLTTDFSKHEVAIDEQRFVGYERFAGHLHRELVRAARQYRAKGGVRGNKIDINPEAIITKIITDTSVNLVEEVNPVHEVKTQEESTFGGTGFRSEDTMVRRTRGQQENFTGVVSEAGKDSGKVGFIHYMTSDPKITDYRGNVDLSMPTTSTGMFSVVGNLMYGSTKDDRIAKPY